jgi:hypothetical protein
LRSSICSLPSFWRCLPRSAEGVGCHKTNASRSLTLLPYPLLHLGKVRMNRLGSSLNPVVGIAETAAEHAAEIPLFRNITLLIRKISNPSPLSSSRSAYDVKNVGLSDSLANTLDPDMSSSILEAIRHPFAEPVTISSDHVRSEQFDTETAVVLQKHAKKILFVPPATLH